MANPFGDDHRITFDMIDPPARPALIDTLPRSPLSNISEEHSPRVEPSAQADQLSREPSAVRPPTNQFDSIEDKTPALKQKSFRWSRRIHPIGLAVIVLLIIALVISTVALSLATANHSQLDKTVGATAGQSLLASTKEVIGQSTAVTFESQQSSLYPPATSTSIHPRLTGWDVVQTQQTTVVTTASPTIVIRTEKYTWQAAAGQSSTFTNSQSNTQRLRL